MLDISRVISIIWEIIDNGVNEDVDHFGIVWELLFVLLIYSLNIRLVMGFFNRNLIINYRLMIYHLLLQ
jgi:hypothetical protein